MHSNRLGIGGILGFPCFVVKMLVMVAQNGQIPEDYQNKTLNSFQPIYCILVTLLSGWIELSPNQELKSVSFKKMIVPVC